MSRKYCFTIEVRVPDGPKGWQKLVDSEIKQAIEKLKTVVEELGGKVCVRY
ncbi:MAG: hypothetical protein NWE85_05180 [Candidatus Bathyarchaeota archaeon]|nr:hypothetical protein [Candidatus Bathyarchaeota archaeon]